MYIYIYIHIYIIHTYIHTLTLFFLPGETFFFSREKSLLLGEKNFFFSREKSGFESPFFFLPGDCAPAIPADYQGTCAPRTSEIQIPGVLPVGKHSALPKSGRREFLGRRVLDSSRGCSRSAHACELANLGNTYVPAESCALVSAPPWRRARERACACWPSSLARARRVPDEHASSTPVLASARLVVAGAP